LTCIAALPATAAQTDDCTLLWRVTARLATPPRQLQVRLEFDSGARSRTTLRLPSGWAGLDEIAAADGDASVAAPITASASSPRTAAARAEVPNPQLQPVRGAPMLRTAAHAPGQRVALQWRLTLDDAAAHDRGVQWTARWFAFSGQGLLPMPDELDDAQPPAACVLLDGLPTDSRWTSSLGQAEGASALFRVAPGPAPLAVRVQQALYAGGALQAQTRTAGDTTVTAVTPADAGWRFGLDALAQAAAEALAAQRRQWDEHEALPPWLVLLLPAPAAPAAHAAAGGTAWQQALALQAGPELSLPSPAFDTLIAGALAHAWVADRFGPLAYAGRGDEALRAWFSEGWADFLAHRQLLREGRWTPRDYAAALNARISAYLDSPDRTLPNAPLAAAAASQPALAALQSARGEWLALRWHNALRAAGQPGLEALMRRLLVPPSQARREGPVSAPLATHRLLAALRKVLGEQPMRDLDRLIEQGEAFDFAPGALGPCFVGQTVSLPSWQLGFDAESLRRQVVSGVQADGPAAAAGLRDGMRLVGHALVPGDPTQPVWLQVLGEDGRRQDISWLPAGAPVRALPRYQPVADAMQQPACLGWLGLGPQAAGAASARATAKGPRRAAGKATAHSAAKNAAHSASKPAGRTGNKKPSRKTAASPAKTAASAARR
jgi:hypothetical protein